MQTDAPRIDIRKTLTEYNAQLTLCQNEFTTRLTSYTSAQEVLRVQIMTDMIYTKIMRIRETEEDDGDRNSIVRDYVLVANESVMALLRCTTDPAEKGLSNQQMLAAYTRLVRMTKRLMVAKNHDYGEAWRDMRPSTFTDLILMKLLRITSILKNEGKTLISEGVDAGYQDIFNYSMFALIQMEQLSLQ